MAKFFLKFKKILLVIGDIIILYFSLWVVLAFRYGSHFNPAVFKQHFIPFTIIYLIWLFVFYVSGLYDLGALRKLFSYYLFFRALVINTLISSTFFYFIPYFGVTPKTNLFLTIAVFVILFVLWRYLYTTLIHKFFTSMESLIIIGETRQSKGLIEVINQNPYLGYKILANFDLNDKRIKNLKNMIIRNQINTIIFTADLFKDSNSKQIFYKCLPFTSFKDFTEFYEEVMKKVPIGEIDQMWFLRSLREEEKRMYKKIKRVMDILVSLILGLLTAILLPFVTLAIKIEGDGPIFYKQKRMGKNGKLFDLIKFRSMKQGAENQEALWAAKNDPRITKTGIFLRKTSIDELPQFINILKGDMSVVGPRPERPEFQENLIKEIPFYQIRHLIKPGLTGWAQINFPYGCSIEDTLEKLQYELYYIKNRSLTLDLKIILKTLGLYLKGERSKLAH